jgi:ribosome-associated toxin RatA of RatAB toxin-antitoxin module
VHTETVARIDGSADAVFAYAARVEDWPRLLPHYRSVRVIASGGGGRLVEMRARRDRIPVWWWARQVVLPDERRIRYTHVRGVTRGMEVEWRITPAGGSVMVTIVHDLRLRWPLIGRIVADRIIGPKFVEPIAGATLDRIKWLVEHGPAVPPPPTQTGRGARR